MRGDVWFFERVAPVYDYLAPSVDPAVLEEAIDHAGRSVDRVLDIGGGTGRAIRALEGRERIVLDASRRMLERVPERIRRIQADARALPLTRSIDAVLVVDALHHLPERERVLDATVDVLRPGGVLVIHEFDPSTLRGRLLRRAERLVGMDSRFWTLDELVDALSATGVDVTVIESGFSVTVVGRK